jgi:hypothetical protein
MAQQCIILSQGGSETKSSSVAAGYQNFIVCIGKISLITIYYWYLLAELHRLH